MITGRLEFGTDPAFGIIIYDNGESAEVVVAGNVKFVVNGDPNETVKGKVKLNLPLDGDVCEQLAKLLRPPVAVELTQVEE